MSIAIVQHVNNTYPHLLLENTGTACHWFTQHLIEHLRANGREAFLMCKTRGEGQYTPVGFQPRDVMGLDGKMYRCTGVSHDAIWCDGRQFDTIGGANEYDKPIYRKSSDPGWSFNPSDGPQIIGQPVWHEIAKEHWRPNNPPLKMDAVISPPIPPTPQPAPAPTLPDRGELMEEMAHLHEVFKRDLLRPDGLWINGHPDFEGIAAWVLDVYLVSRMAGRSRERARETYVNAIRNSQEYQDKHPGTSLI